MEILQIIIPKRMKDQRIDAALSEMIPDYSRSKITAWIKSGEALINNKTFKPKDKVNGNETVCLKLKQKDNNHWLPEKINLDIVFEDDEQFQLDQDLINESHDVKVHLPMSHSNSQHQDE